MSDNLVATLTFLLAMGMLAGLAQLRRIEALVAPAGENRIPGLDGLRGLLAVAVFGHHCAALRLLAQTGTWQEPPGNLANLMGKFAVAVFFMVSAYLFVGRFWIAAGHMKLGRFFWGRLTRLLPIYTLAVALALAAVWYLSPWPIHTIIADLLKNSPGWLGFGFLRLSDIGGVEHSGIMLSPTWSLRYEWLLYFALPFVCILFRLGMSIFLIALGFIMLYPADPWFAFFGLGSLAALPPVQRYASARGTTWLAGLAGLALALFFHDITHPAAMTLAFFLFVILLNNKRLTHLLDQQWLVFSGQLSYSIYLLHLPLLLGIALTGFGLRTIAGWDSVHYLLFCAGVSALIAMVATTAHLLIERPGMRLGRWSLFKPAGEDTIQKAAAP